MADGSRRGGSARLTLSAIAIFLAALASFFYLSGGAENSEVQSGSVQVVGSETMRPVVTACAEEFMTRNPQADIAVKGGGSGDGIAAVLHGIVDVGMTSRELSSRERDYAASQGIEISVVELALDGIAVIVNRANPIVALDLAQLRKIFAGEIRDWRELGGANGEIQVFARAAGSGTASLFDERVLRDDPYVTTASQLPTNEAIVAEVGERPLAIGYSGLGALASGNEVKVVALCSDAQSRPTSPTPDAIRTGGYPLSRTLYFTTADTPSGTVEAFLDFCSGAGGQALLRKAGYVGITPAAQ